MVGKRIKKDIGVLVGKRLSELYDKAFLEGYRTGAEETHDIWVTEMPKVKGIGPKLIRRIMLHMTAAMYERVLAKKSQKEKSM